MIPGMLNNEHGNYFSTFGGYIYICICIGIIGKKMGDTLVHWGVSRVLPVIRAFVSTLNHET